MLLEAKQQHCRRSKHTENQSQGKNKKRTASIATKMPLSQSKKSKKADHNSDSCMENDSDDAECIYYGELWSECKDDIIQCTNCLKWAHAACAGRDDDGFICDFCD